MTLVDLNPVEIDIIIHILRLEKGKVGTKRKPLPKLIKNCPNEIQSII